MSTCSSGTLDDINRDKPFADSPSNESRIMKKALPEDPSSLIDERIASLDDWRGARLSRLRTVIKNADPEVTETVKWKKPTNPGGVPVWECSGVICTGETYRGKIKLTFARGASLHDPAGLFNSSLGGKVRRAIDIRENDPVDEDALKALVQAAAALNKSSSQ